jgi:ABC-type transport system substrate-binding protein
MKRLVFLVLAFALISSAFVETMNIKQVAAQPRRDLEITWYSDASSCYSALKNQEVDIDGYALTHEQFEDAQADPAIQLASYDENGIFEFDINNNYSIISYPNVRSPTSVLEVRQAIAQLINKSYIVEEVLPKFWSNIIDVPISNVLSGWWNTSVTGSNYPYPYNPDSAAALLASLGFNDTDGNGYLNYPTDWPGIQNLHDTDTTRMPLKIYAILDSPDRLASANYLVHQLEGGPLAKADWPSNFTGGDFAVEFMAPHVVDEEVMLDRNYHIFTGAWRLSQTPSADMYYLFHSIFWYPYGSNYVTGAQYPDLDEELEKTYHAEDISTAMFHCKNAQGLLVDKYCVCIWLWNYVEFNAYRKGLAGAVSQQGWGLDNQYTYLTSYRSDDPAAPTRLGVTYPSGRTPVPAQLNVLYSMWVAEWQMLDKVYPVLMSETPYALEDQPWVAQDWEVGTWYDPRDGMNKTKVTFWLRTDVGCAEPQTGNLVDFFSADDFEFTVWYTYAFTDAWTRYSVSEVNHIKIVNDHQVEVYFDSHDLRLLYGFGKGTPLLGPQDVLIGKLCEEASATFTGADLLEVAPGYFEYQFTLDRIVKVINATVDGDPIRENEDFYVRGGYDVITHNIFVNLTSLAPTDSVTINYYRAIPNGADGFYLGGNLGYDWNDTMYSYGPYYPTSIDVANSNAALKRNPHFFLETPLLGEIDWRWYWEGTTKPRSGHYAISIFDIVKSAVAYDTRGDGGYNPRYLPAADIDPNDPCHIGIYDIVTATGGYGKNFGAPPVH